MTEFTDEELYQLLEDEILVDCYNPEERVSAWFCWLNSEMTFPFRVHCVRADKKCFLKAGEEAMATELVEDDRTARKASLLVDWQGRSVPVPMECIEPVNASEFTARAIAAWQYWHKQGWE